MQDEGPYADEAPPTDEELRAARALAQALDAPSDPERGSLAELARAARATVHVDATGELPEIASRLAREGVSDGLARRRGAQRRVAIAALAAAAIAIAGFSILGPKTDRAMPDEIEALAMPPLAAWPRERELEGEGVSARVDRMAQLAREDWLAAELAEARSTEAP